MKKLYYRLYQRGKAEDGQSMLEFVLVLPVFMLLLALVLDFGWLFYTQLGVENSARNAARIACVEYTRVAYDQSAKRPDVEYSPTGVATSFSKTYELSQYDNYLTDENVSVEDENCPLTDQEKEYCIRSSHPYRQILRMSRLLLLIRTTKSSLLIRPLQNIRCQIAQTEMFPFLLPALTTQ